MDMALGTYRKGQVVLDDSVNWPDAVRVVVQPLEKYGLTEGVWPDDDSPEGRAEILARMDAVEPLELTPADEAEIASAREQVRQVTLDAVRKQMGLP